MNEVRLTQTRVGTPKFLCRDEKGREVYSSIDRQPVDDAEIFLTWTGLAGDQPTDTRAKKDGGQMHGGHDKAVYAYPVEHYAAWRELLGPDGVGARTFGENLCVQGVTETTVRIGDVWYIGNVQLRVSKVRTPCRVLRLYFGNPKISHLMYETGMCGWYLEVLGPGLMPTTGVVRIAKAAGGPTVAQAFAEKQPV